MTKSSTDDININDLNCGWEYVLAKVYIPIFTRVPYYSFGEDNEYNSIQIISSNVTEEWDYYEKEGILNALYNIITKWKRDYVLSLSNTDLNLIDGETYYFCNCENVNLHGNAFIIAVDCYDFNTDTQMPIVIRKGNHIKIRNNDNVDISDSSHIQLTNCNCDIDNCKNVKISGNSNVNATNCHAITYNGNSKGIIERCNYVYLNGKSENIVKDSTNLNILGNDTKHKIYNCSSVFISGRGRCTIDLYSTHKICASGISNIINIFDNCDGYIKYSTVVNVYGTCNLKVIGPVSLYVFTADSYIVGYEKSKIYAHKYSRINTYGSIVKQDTSNRIIKDIIPGTISTITSAGGIINIYGYADITGYEKAIINTFFNYD